MAATGGSGIGWLAARGGTDGVQALPPASPQPSPRPPADLGRGGESGHRLHPGQREGLRGRLHGRGAVLQVQQGGAADGPAGRWGPKGQARRDGAGPPAGRCVPCPLAAGTVARAGAPHPRVRACRRSGLPQARRAPPPLGAAHGEEDGQRWAPGPAGAGWVPPPAAAARPGSDAGRSVPQPGSTRARSCAGAARTACAKTPCSFPASAARAT